MSQINVGDQICNLQFIKAVVVSHVFRRKHQETLVYTGQHFVCNMSELFLEN